MEILQLTYFCHAAECENFSNTAQHFDVPTSNISRAVRAIEKELGVKLFNRAANKLSLNENGKEFYKHVKKALTELHLGTLSVSENALVPSGEIKILISTCRRIVTQAIEICQKNYPDISFAVKHGVDNEEYDFIISDNPPHKGDYDKFLLTKEKLLFAIPKTLPIYQKLKNGDVGLLKNERFISLGKGTRLHDLTVQICRSFGFDPNISIQTDDPYYVRKYVEMGLGVALYPEKSWAYLVPNGAKLIDLGAPNRRIYVFVKRDSSAPSAQNVFLEILGKSFE